ncbi:MAG: ABC transporter ATP-binding protein [Promethearchaeota archaeon]
MVYAGLDAEEYDRTYSDRELFRRILKYFRQHTKKMIVVIIFLVLTSITAGVLPYLTSLIIKQLETTSSTTMVVALVIVTLIMNISSYLFNYINKSLSAVILNSVTYQLRADVESQVLIQDMSFFDKYPTGKIVSRINSDSQNFFEMAQIFIDSISSFLVVIIMLVPMFIIDAKLTLIFLAMVPLIFLFTLSFRKVARKKTLQGQRVLANVHSFVQETMNGIQIAKTFRQENTLYREFKDINKKSYKINLNRALFMNFIFPGLGLIQGIMLALILYYGGESVLKNPSISVSTLYLFIQSLWGLFFPLFSIAAFWPQFQTGMAAAERIFALIDSKPQVIQKGSKKLEKIRGEVSINNLCFSYTPEKPVFDNFSLRISPGESVAIVGHTGAGKSSLARILLRFYEFQNGTITIDGQDIRFLDLHTYRRRMGLIPQTPFLWGDTLENNVKYGNPDATREEVLWALEQAGGGDWVNDLSNGLDTNIRERGKLLSMGQRQLVVFARVLLQDPSILILDEATASVDPFTETRIQEALEKIMENRTSIIIAHRLRTVRHVDRIVVLDHGKIVEQGNHEDLMQKNGYYARLYNTYFKHQSYEFINEIHNKA